jgi:hypothetical protein
MADLPAEFDNQRQALLWELALAIPAKEGVIARRGICFLQDKTARGPVSRNTLR